MPSTRQMSQAGKKEPMMSNDGARLQPDASHGINAISKKRRASVIARGIRRSAMLLFWNCLQINRPNTTTLTVVGTRLHFASDRIPNAPNDRLPAPPFEVVAMCRAFFDLGNPFFLPGKPNSRPGNPKNPLKEPISDPGIRISHVGK